MSDDKTRIDMQFGVQNFNPEASFRLRPPTREEIRLEQWYQFKHYAKITLLYAVAILCYGFVLTSLLSHIVPSNG